MARYFQEQRPASILAFLCILSTTGGQGLSCNLSAGLGGIGYNNHPDHCDQFVQCAPLRSPFVHNCSFGQYFSLKQLTCVKSEDANCPHDPCVGQADGAAFPMRDNCRGFWSCQQSRSYATCCDGSQTFQDGEGCVDSETCEDECPVQQSNNYEDPCNLFEKDPNNPSRYLSRHPVNLGESLPCPPGTTFSETTCMCTNHVEVKSVKQCQPVVYQAPDGTLRGQNGERIYTSPSSALFLPSDHQDTTLGKQSITITGEESITIWRLAQYDFQQTIEIEMYLTVSSTERGDIRVETVLTNDLGQSGSPSIHIEVFRSQDPVVALMAVLKTDHGQSQSILAVVESGVPTKLIFAYNGRIALVYTSTDTNDALFYSPLTGNIELRQSAVTLGSSSTPPSTVTNFNGTISELSIGSCLSDFTFDLFEQADK